MHKFWSLIKTALVRLSIVHHDMLVKCDLMSCQDLSVCCSWRVRNVFGRNNWFYIFVQIARFDCKSLVLNIVDRGLELLFVLPSELDNTKEHLLFAFCSLSAWVSLPADSFAVKERWSSFQSLDPWQSFNSVSVLGPRSRSKTSEPYQNSGTSYFR